MATRFHLILLCCALVLSNPAGAGQTCEEREVSPKALYDASRIALQIRSFLDASGAELALIGRAGADVSRYGLTYTHMGIVLRDHPKGRWFFVHMLNRCATDTAALYDDGLINFFTDDPYRLVALVIIPSPSLQHRLRRNVLGSLAIKLHQPRYSMIAYPFADQYENSNQWVLELIAASQAPERMVASRRDAQRYLADKGYKPDRIPISAMERLGATLFRANMHFDDHPLAERLQGEYQVVTVESVLRYLEGTDAGVTKRTIQG